jgi:poly(hydroxyalkanoate) granule-associated protein
MVARTRRTTRTARKATSPAGKFNQIRANALQTVNTLVKQGTALQARGRKLATAKVKEARAMVKGARQAVMASADVARSRTNDAVSQLEKVFEVRVSNAISKLGVPTARDVRALSRQVAQLQHSVDSLRRSRARARA